MNYQLLPDMTADQYAALKSDIADRGVMIPLEYDEKGNLLDGHHRLRACIELGITDFPKIVRHFATEEEKRYHVRAVNANRRQLTQEQRRQIIIAQLKDAPQKSDRQIATGLGVSHHTVGAQRQELESRGQIAHADKVIDTLGREQPRQREKLESTAEIPQFKTNVGADGKERPRQVERKNPPVIQTPPEPDIDPLDVIEDYDEYVTANQMEIEECETPSEIKILDFGEKEPPHPKVFNLQDRQRQEYEAFDRKLDLGHDNFKKLAKIVDAADNFSPTDENIESMLWCFDDLVTLDDQITYINETIEKLQITKMKLLKGKKHEKGKYSSSLC